MNYKVLINEKYEEGRKLIKQDELSYQVLYQVLGEPVKKIVTDDENFIIAHTARVFPTWIWAPDNASDSLLEEIYQILKKEFSPLAEYRFNTKYEVADYLISRIKKEEKIDFKVSVNIAAYVLDNPIQPKKEVRGKLRCLEGKDYELAVRMIEEASVAIGDRILSREESERAAKEQLKEKVLFVWENELGETVSFCDRHDSENYVKISQVYTPEKYRGNGYAAQMIYELCKLGLSTGKQTGNVICGCMTTYHRTGVIGKSDLYSREK